MFIKHPSLRSRMSEREVLEELGFTPAEAAIYLALLETGSTLTGPVIKKTKLHRGTVYQILQRLEEKGLVSSVIKGKKQYFEAAPPEHLLDLLKSKEDKLSGIMPMLKAKNNASKEKQRVTVYTGVKGIRTVMDRILEDLTPRGSYYDFGVSGLFREVMGPYWELWQRRKRKSNIKSMVIFTEEQRRSSLVKEYFGEARFHPKEFQSVTDTIIYNDTVVLFIWTAKPPVAIVIENKENALSYKNQFMFMWKFAKK